MMWLKLPGRRPKGDQMKSDQDQGGVKEDMNVVGMREEDAEDRVRLGLSNSCPRGLLSCKSFLSSVQSIQMNGSLTDL